MNLKGSTQNWQGNCIVLYYLLPNYSRMTRFDNDNEQIDDEHW